MTRPAGGRWAIRGAEILPIAGSRRSEGSPIAPAIAKWLIVRRTRDRLRGSDKGSARSQVHGGYREGGLLLLGAGALTPAILPNGSRRAADRPFRPSNDADQARSIRARFAPGRRGPNEEQP